MLVNEHYHLPNRKDDKASLRFLCIYNVVYAMLYMQCCRQLGKKIGKKEYENIGTKR